MNKRTLIYLLMLVPLLGVMVGGIVMQAVHHQVDAFRIVVTLALFGAGVAMAFFPEKVLVVNAGTSRQRRHIPIPGRWQPLAFASYAGILTSVAIHLFFESPLATTLFCALFFLSAVDLVVVALVVILQAKR